MKIIAACEDTGAIKIISAQHGTDTSKPTDETTPNAVVITTHAQENNTRKSKVLQLCHSKKTGHIIVTRLNGSVEVYQVLPDPHSPGNEEDKKSDETNIAVDLLPLIYENKSVLPPFTEPGNETFISVSITDSDRVIVATNKGSVLVWSSVDKITQDPVKYVLPLNSKEIVEAFQIHPGKEYDDYVAYGGKDTDLRIVKLPTSKSKSDKIPEIVYKAKNVSDTRLDLRVPIHIKNILFDKDSTPENFKLYAFTAFGDMRFYDSSMGRKPRSSVLVLPKKAPIVSALWMDNELVICDNRGIVVKVDPSTGSQLSKFKGQIGTTQALNNFQDSVLAATGFDRYVRVYDNVTRECIVKVFIGTQSNAIAIIEDKESLERGMRRKKLSTETAETIKNKKEQDKNDVAEESSDEEELWSKLESNITQRRKRRKLTLA